MIERPRAVPNLWSILEREGHVPFRRVDCIFERFSARKRRCNGGGKRASRAMRPADSHARRTKFAEIVAVVENVYCILILGVAGERDGSRVPTFYQRRARAQGNQRVGRLADRIAIRHVAAGQDTRLAQIRRDDGGQREHHVTHHRDRVGFEKDVAARRDHHGIDHDIRDFTNADSIRDSADYLSSREHPGFRGGDREVICDRIDLRSDQGRIEIGNGAYA